MVGPAGAAAAGPGPPAPGKTETVLRIAAPGRLPSQMAGPEAMAVWERVQGAVDVLLTDMVMPDGVSGLDLARQLRELKSDLVVIFVSGYSLEDFDSRLLSKEQASFVQKPYSHVTLTAAVRQALDQQG